MSIAETTATAQARKEPAIALPALVQILRRLEEVLEVEIAALRCGDFAKLTKLNDRKEQSLLDLVGLQQAIGQRALDPAEAAELSALRRKLAENRELLKSHLDAASELARVFAQLVKDSESDGTYGPATFRANTRP